MPMINWLAVLGAALSMFVVGGLWYSPLLFERPWRRAAGLDETDLKRGNPVLIFACAFVVALLMATNLALFLAGPEVTLGFALAAAVAAGLGWAAFGVGLIALFERRPLRYALINGGYLTVGFAVMGLILGLWR